VPQEQTERPWSSSTPTPDPRAAARSDTCTAPRCAQRSAGSGGPLRHGRLCRRPGRPVPAESPSRALGIQGEGKGVRPKASQSAKDFLIELPERDTSRPGLIHWRLGTQRAECPGAFPPSQTITASDSPLPASIPKAAASRLTRRK